jgi:hypothetical protein
MRTLGCTYGQGYHFARPLPVAGVMRAFGLDPVRVDVVPETTVEPTADLASVDEPAEAAAVAPARRSRRRRIDREASAA